jgi:hypothetical protein
VRIKTVMQVHIVSPMALDFSPQYKSYIWTEPILDLAESKGI